MPGLAKQHQRGDKNAESINLSPALCEPLGARFELSAFAAVMPWRRFWKFNATKSTL
jgi:hypothetical protein